jgi:glutamine amidotransferase PdxT
MDIKVHHSHHKTPPLCSIMRKFNTILRVAFSSKKFRTFTVFLVAPSNVASSQDVPTLAQHNVPRLATSILLEHTEHINSSLLTVQATLGGQLRAARTVQSKVTRTLQPFQITVSANSDGKDARYFTTDVCSLAHTTTHRLQCHRRSVCLSVSLSAPHGAVSCAGSNVSAERKVSCTIHSPSRRRQNLSAQSERIKAHTAVQH